jgi:hypothetical protein
VSGGERQLALVARALAQEPRRRSPGAASPWCCRRTTPIVTADSLREIYGVAVDVLALPDDRGRRVCVPRLTRPGGVSSGPETRTTGRS